MSTAVQHTIQPIPGSVGNFPIGRYLPSHIRQMVGPFIFMDLGGPLEIPAALEGGTPEHPHAGLSTFTYLMQGSVQHTDSAGHRAVVEQGDVALMTSGSGITHEELPPGGLDPAQLRRVEFAQMWLALPDEVEDMDPTFQHVKAAELPVVDLAGGSARIGIGTGWDATAPTHIHTDTLFAEVKVAPGGTITIEPNWEERAVILLNGDASIDDRPMKPLDLPVLEPSTTARISSSSGARLLVFGGERFASTRHIAGSFVASSPDKIHQWMTDYSIGRFPRIDRARTS
ncbi:MAG: pirin family protein [Ilumatobacter sp.]